MRFLLALILFLGVAKLDVDAQVPELWSFSSDGGLNGKGLLYKVYGDGNGYKPILSFDTVGVAFPLGELCVWNGNIFGFAFGKDDSFFVYSVNISSNKFLRKAVITPNQGGQLSTLITSRDKNFSAPLIVNNKLYVVSMKGGNNGLGTIFYYDFISESVTKIFDFDSITGYYNDLYNVLPPELFYKNGSLYNVATHGGANTYGTLYSIDTIGLLYQKHYDFNDDSLGRNPLSNLLAGDNGEIFFVADGGKNGCGVILSYDQNNVKLVHSFLKSSEGCGTASWIKGDDNKFYGSLSTGYFNCLPNSIGCGTIFRYDFYLNELTVLHGFTGISTGYFPKRKLNYASDGRLYGQITYNFGCNSYRIDVVGASFDVILNANPDSNDIGYNSTAGFTQVNRPVLRVNENQGSDFLFELIPNPSSSQLLLNIKNNTISKNDLVVQIYDVVGALVYENEMKESFLKIDIAHLSKGLYFVNVFDGDFNAQSQRFIKK